MSVFKWFTACALASTIVFSAQAEAHCPGNVESIPLRLFGRSLITVPVMLNKTGPYDFVLDTGTQITVIDPKLASDLQVVPSGAAHVTGFGVNSQVDYGQLEVLEAGAQSINHMLVLVENLKQIYMTDARIRGILGEDFLEHYDLLIDYQHHIVCLDGTKGMQEGVKGKKVGLTPPPHGDEYLPFTLPLIVSTQISGMGNGRLRLLLDSGVEVPVLFESGLQLTGAQFLGPPVQSFAALQALDIQVGDHVFRQVSFVTPAATGNALAQKPVVDGLLPTAMFRSAFISYVDHCVVLNPR